MFVEGEGIEEKNGTFSFKIAISKLLSKFQQT